MFANGVVAPDDEAGWLAPVFQVLGRMADGSERKYPCSLAHHRPAGHHRMGDQGHLGPELDFGTDATERPDAYIVGETRGGIDDRGGMDIRHHSSMIMAA